MNNCSERVSSKHQRIYNCSFKFDNTMGIDIRHTILLMLVTSFAAGYLPHATCSCSGPCVVGGSTSYDFMGDPAVNIDMASPDEFIRESLSSGKTSLSVKSLLLKTAINNSTSLNQTNKVDISQNNTTVLVGIDSKGNETSKNATCNSRIVKLGASSVKEKRL
jgi:hypothetical protein